MKNKIFKRYIIFLRDIIRSGSRISLKDIHDMINVKECIFIINTEVRNYFQFTPSEWKNESQMVFSSSVSIGDVIKRLRSAKLSRKKDKRSISF